MSTSPSLSGGEKRHWWVSNRKMVEKYVKDARLLTATNDNAEIAAAINLLDAALALSPRLESALELKARSLLYLRRFKEVADMLQDYIPSYKMVSEEEGSLSSEISSQQLSRERVKLLPQCSSSSRLPSLKCFSVSDLKKKVLAGLHKNCEREREWRYLVLGQACFYLGLMEDAMVLLQTGKRLASAAFRRESICWSDDSFSFPTTSITGDINPPSTATCIESECTAHLLSNIKLLLRRRTAALAALDAGLHNEAIRHFSKILDSRRSTPQSFLADCYIHRAAAYRAAGRIAEAIADCNRALALDASCIPALSTRASLLETIRSFSDCLRDLDHLKLLYDTILRDKKLPGPAWKQHGIRYRDVAGNLRALTEKIQGLRQQITSGEAPNVDYYALIGLRRGCSRSELECAYLLLSLRHRPDRATAFIDRCDLVNDRDIDAIKDQAKMSALLLYRLLQKGYACVMTAIMDEEYTEKQRQRAALDAKPFLPTQHDKESNTKTLEFETNQCSRDLGYITSIKMPFEKAAASAPSPIFQGVFCRDIDVVGNILSQVGINRPLPVNYEALSC